MKIPKHFFKRLSIFSFILYNNYLNNTTLLLHSHKKHLLIYNQLIIKKKNMKKIIALLALVFLIGLAPQMSMGKLSTKTELKAKNNIKVGANLKEYKRPIKKQCDISVPAQYSTIQDAVDAAVDGDTVCVGPGTYNENQIKITKAIRLTGNGFVNPSIINSSNPYSTIQILSGNVMIEGFVINGVGLGKYNSAILILADAGPNITIQYNHIISADGSIALRSDGRSENYIVQNNVLTGNNSFSILYIDSHLPTFTVWNNTFTGTVNDTNYGSVLQTAANSSIQHNIFDASGTMRWLLLYGCVSGTINVNYNNFNSDDAQIKVEACQGTINAENNWWGDNDPSDNVKGLVDFMPFAIKPFKQEKLKY